jgi:hypothetical protein
VLTLCVIPALYALVKQWELRRQPLPVAQPSIDAGLPAATL